MCPVDVSSNLPPITAVMTGAGNRGRDTFGEYALHYPHKLKFVAVAEPDAIRRRQFQKLHQISDQYAFESWDQMLTQSQGQLADVAFICTQDAMHFSPAMAALKLDYDILLEKPISPRLEECHAIVQLATVRQRYVQICHVLRYTPFWQKIKQIIEEGTIGRIIDYDHSENVSFWHFGHSFVRGPYQRKSDSSSMILAKCCHDLDLMYWIIGMQPLTVQSEGDVSFYRPENAPSGSPTTCSEQCPEFSQCPWYAPRLYLDGDPIIRTGLLTHSRIIRKITRMALEKHPFIHLLAKIRPELKQMENWNQWPSTVLTLDPTRTARAAALAESKYNICIYRAGNDVCDHQIATFRFPHGVIGTLRVLGLSEYEGREIRIFGSRGVLRGYFRQIGEEIQVTTFRDSEPHIVYNTGLSFDAHGGGDVGLVNHFLTRLQQIKSEGRKEWDYHTTDVIGAIESHVMAFAAEDARLSHQTVDVSNYRARNSL